MINRKESKIKKIKLYGVGNQGDFNYYIFDKRQFVAEHLSKVLNNVFGIHWEFGYELQSKKINIEKDKDCKDSHETISANENVRVNVFYGDKKMFMTLDCSEKDRLKFNEELFKMVLMPKPKEIKKNKN